MRKHEPARSNPVPLNDTRRLAITIAGVCCLALPRTMFPQAHHESALAKTEDQVFDKNRVTPLQLLRNLYEKNRVLILGFPDHAHETQYQMLDSLLQSVGKDPRLKFIFLERSSEDTPMLQEASTKNLSMPDLIDRFPGKDPITGFPSKRRASFSICLDEEWAYTWSQFLPGIRAINAQRPAGNPLLVSSIDGISATAASEAQTQSAAISVMEGVQRESTTAANFWRTLWPKLGSSYKVIMMYHLAHVIKTFTVVDDDGQQGPSNWMSRLLHDHPEVESQIAIVSLDPIDSAEGVFRFTQRQGARYPGKAFGIPLAPFQGILTQPDTATFVHEPHGGGAQDAGLLINYGMDLGSPKSLPAMVSGIIGVPNVAQWRWKSMQSYVPECGTIPFRLSGG